MKPILTLSMLVLILATIGGCGENLGAAAPGLPNGRTFLSTSVSEGGKPRPLVRGSRIQLIFAGGELRANAGCNSYSGRARMESDRLHVDGVGGTEMGCDPQLMDQDGWLIDFLASEPTLRRDGDTLVLTSEDTEVRLLDRAVAEPDRPLRGTRWEADGLFQGKGDEGIASSMPAGVRAWMTFGDDGRVSGNTGCNRFSARYTESGSRITFSGLSATRMACSGAADAVERVVLAVLEGPAEYAIEADVLTLRSSSGQGIGLREK